MIDDESKDGAGRSKADESEQHIGWPDLSVIDSLFILFPLEWVLKMCMISNASWEQSELKVSVIRYSDFLALNKSSNDLVVIKKMKMLLSDDEIESESKRLKECQTPFVVKCYDLLQHNDELWVRIGCPPDCVDGDGVLPLWVYWSVFEISQSTERRRNQGDCELLFVGVTVSAQSKRVARSGYGNGE